MDWWHSFNKTLGTSNTILEPPFQNKKHTLLQSVLHSWSKKCWSITPQKSGHPNSLSPTSPWWQTCSLFPARKHPFFLHSKSIRLCSVTFTFGLLRLLKKCHWWVKWGENSYPGRHLETSRPSGVFSERSQSSTGTTHTNHNYHMSFTEGEHVSGFLQSF